jgi:hypothetical protein
MRSQPRENDNRLTTRENSLRPREVRARERTCRRLVGDLSEGVPISQIAYPSECKEQTDHRLNQLPDFSLIRSINILVCRSWCVGEEQQLCSFSNSAAGLASWRVGYFSSRSLYHSVQTMQWTLYTLFHEIYIFISTFLILIVFYSV